MFESLCCWGGFHIFMNLNMKTTHGDIFMLQFYSVCKTLAAKCDWHGGKSCSSWLVYTCLHVLKLFIVNNSIFPLKCIGFVTFKQIINRI